MQDFFGKLRKGNGGLLLRLFFGLALPTDVRQFLSEQARAMRIQGRYTDADNYHVTLHFLGDTAPAMLAALRRAADCARICSPVQLTLSGTGRFAKRSGDVAWMGVTLTPSLLQLHAVLGDALQDAGYTVEREYRPHITLVRNAKGLLPECTTSHTTTIGALTLFHSTRVHDRLQYVPLYTTPLGGDSHAGV